MPFPTPGTNITSRVSFNSGTIDFGANRLVQVDNVTLGWSATTEPLYVLGSIKAQDIVRHTSKAMLTGKIKSFAPEADALAYGTVVSGSPQIINVLDGQPTLLNPVVTLFDRNGKQIVYQFINALFKSSKVTMKAEDYSEFDFELDAIDIQILYTV